MCSNSRLELHRPKALDHRLKNIYIKALTLVLADITTVPGQIIGLFDACLHYNGISIRSWACLQACADWQKVHLSSQSVARGQ